MMHRIRAFLSKIKTLFSIFKNVRGELLSPPSCAPEYVVEYALISLNMPRFS